VSLSENKVYRITAPGDPNGDYRLVRVLSVTINNAAVEYVDVPPGQQDTLSISDFQWSPYAGSLPYGGATGWGGGSSFLAAAVLFGLVLYMAGRRRRG